jgi:acetyl-CoA carboxylase biotin carboxyl carrier protein
MDLKTIKSLVQLMVENDLSRLELREGDTHILLRRGHPTVRLPTGSAAPGAPGGTVPPPATGPAAGESATSAVGSAKEYLIRSPMVGTFRAAPDPESPPLVKVGDEVQPDTVVCLIEAMKVLNEIKAETRGRITKVFVKNAEAVEFDQPLFAVEPG